jgi:hypothetical protein
MVGKEGGEEERGRIEQIICCAKAFDFFSR